MAGKKKNVLKDVPVDIMDNFIRSKYKQILGVVSVIIIIFAGFYSYNKYSAAKKEKMSMSIGEKEIKGLYSEDRIADYSDLASTLSFAKDYIHIQAGQHYLMMGYNEKAVYELSNTGGGFSEYSKSLLYDISDSGINPENMLDGMFSSVWYYRAVLAAPADEREYWIEKYRNEWPDSVLLDKIYSWGL